MTCLFFQHGRVNRHDMKVSMYDDNRQMAAGFIKFMST
ncbi:hypothetical protein JCM19233_777 [Vibrio astriarenae]|nr:hypothetical protein JCM19233_777 [Vibrio sp. C7]